MQTAYIPVPKPPKAQPAPAWSSAAVMALYALPFMDLVFRAQQTHRAHFDPNGIQLSSLLSIKTGGCPEDCGYCSQSSRYDTGLEAEKLMPLDEVLAAARAAQAGGAQRFCMGAAWRSPKPHHLEAVAEMVSAVKALGLETCVTLGMLREGQAEQLKAAGLDYYNHNLDTSPEFYGKIVTTRTYQDRLDTLDRVRGAGINVCCGGIVGMGESRQERAGLIATGQHGALSRVGADQQPDAGGRHATGRRRAARSVRVRAHHRRGAHHHAARRGAPLGRARGHG